MEYTISTLGFVSDQYEVYRVRAHEDLRADLAATFTREVTPALVALYQSGETISTLVEASGFARSRVIEALTEAGVYTPGVPGRPRGARR
jgi:hypothetical protein